MLFLSVFLMLTVQSVILLYPMHYLLTPKYSKRAQMLLWVVPVLLIPMMRLVIFLGENTGLQFLLMLLSWAAALIIGYRDIWWKRVIAALLVVVNSLVGDVVVMLVITVWFPEYLNSVNMINGARIVIYMGGTAVYFLIGCLEIYVWHRFYWKEHMKGLGMLCLLPLTQWLLQISLEEIIWSHGGDGEGAWLLILAQICFFAADIYWFRTILEQNRRVSDTMELDTIRSQMEQEKIRYRQLEEQRETMARIRHDYNNQTDAIRHLIGTDPEAAERMAGEMIRSIRMESEGAEKEVSKA